MIEADEQTSAFTAFPSPLIPPGAATSRWKFRNKEDVSSMETEKKRFHSVRLEKDKCRGCTNCLKRCPTEAIRVRGGRAHIIDERCID